MTRTSAPAAVVTGCGVISPYGRGVEALWRGLVGGHSAARPITRFRADDLTPNVAAEVTEPLPDDADRAGVFALDAARQALADAGLGAAPPDAGVVLGTTLGGMEIFETWVGEARDDLGHVPYFAPAARVARTLGCAGPVVTPQLACASGTHALAMAADLVRRGAADVVLAGGTDLLCRFVVAGFNALRATAPSAHPFDRDRSGLILGEGAAVVVIESAAYAAARGARVRARLAGMGAAADATHMTAPDREGGGAARAMAAALADAGITPAAVDFVSAHGTGTVYNDAMEARALVRVFGPGGVAVNSIKGAVGHMLGAAGALEAVLCIEVMARGLIPPTIGLREVDPACGALDLVRDAPRPQDTRVALSTSSGFAGANAALLFTTP